MLFSESMIQLSTLHSTPTIQTGAAVFKAGIYLCFVKGPLSKAGNTYNTVGNIKAGFSSDCSHTVQHIWISVSHTQLFVFQAFVSCMSFITSIAACFWKKHIPETSTKHLSGSFHIPYMQSMNRFHSFVSIQLFKTLRCSPAINTQDLLPNTLQNSYWFGH